jgi:phosphoenolpyruvate carboxykinase (GTP)
VDDDTAWMRFRADGRLYAANAEAGYLGVVLGTAGTTIPNLIAVIDIGNTRFTDTARTDDGGVWRAGPTDDKREKLAASKLCPAAAR